MTSFFKNRQNLISSLVLLLITFLIYSPTLFFQFIYYDDNEYVFENSRLQGGLGFYFLKWAFTTFHFSNWHPLTWLSYALDWELYGFWPGGYHLTNIVFHSINALLFFILFSRMTGSVEKSFLIAAFFAWHPVRVESVAWIAERKDVLSTFFVLLSLLSYIAYSSRKDQTGKPPYKNTNFALCFLFFVLSLLCKGMYITLPIILLLFDFWPLNSKEAWLTRIIEKIPFVLLSMASCYITVLAQAAGGAIHHFADATLLVRFANFSQAYFDYILLFIWPGKLSIFYPYLINTHVWQSLTMGIIFLILTGILFLRRKAIPALWVGWCLFVITLIPVIGIITIGAQWIACRYLYFPAVGLSIMLVWGGESLLNKLNFPRNAIRFLIAGILSAYLITTSVYLSYWQNSYKLFQHAANVIPHNWIAHVSLRAAYGRDGNHEKAAEHLIEAIKIFPAVTNRIPLHWLDFYYMGAVNLHNGKVFQTESFLREAARRLAEEPPEIIQASDKLIRDNLANCLAAFDSKNPSACVL